MYVTVYTHIRRPRGQQRPVTEHRVYQTKSHTSMHEHLRAKCSGRTWLDPKEVITDFVVGMPLPGGPIVVGGSRVV